MPQNSPDKILGRLDPYEVACAMEAYVRDLDRKSIVRYLIKAADRLPSYYRGSIASQLLSDGRKPHEMDALAFKRIVAQSHDQEALQDALIGCLRGNLRAIPMIGDTFAENVLRYARGEEGAGRRRSSSRVYAVFAGALVAAVAIGAAGERIAEKAPIGPFGATAPARPSPTPQTLALPLPRTQHAGAQPAVRHIAVATAAPTPVPTSAPTQPPTAEPTPATVVSTEAPAAPSPSPSPTPSPNASRQPVGRGAATVHVPTPSPEPTDSPDLTDMPDATQQGAVPSARPAEQPAQMLIVEPTPTPTPTPSKHHRARKHGTPAPQPTNRP